MLVIIGLQCLVLYCMARTTVGLDGIKFQALNHSAVSCRFTINAVINIRHFNYNYDIFNDLHVCYSDYRTSEECLQIASPILNFELNYCDKRSLSLIEENFFFSLVLVERSLKENEREEQLILDQSTLFFHMVPQHYINIPSFLKLYTLLQAPFNLLGSVKESAVDISVDDNNSNSNDTSMPITHTIQIAVVIGDTLTAHLRDVVLNLHIEDVRMILNQSRIADDGVTGFDTVNCNRFMGIRMMCCNFENYTACLPPVLDVLVVLASEDKNVDCDSGPLTGNQASGCGDVHCRSDGSTLRKTCDALSDQSSTILAKLFRRVLYTKVVIIYPGQQDSTDKKHGGSHGLKCADGQHVRSLYCTVHQLVQGASQTSATMSTSHILEWPASPVDEGTLSYHTNTLHVQLVQISPMIVVESAEKEAVIMSDIRTSSKHRRAGESNQISRRNSNQRMRPSSARFRFRNGFNTAVLHNVCLLNATTFVLWKPDPHIPSTLAECEMCDRNRATNSSSDTVTSSCNVCDTQTTKPSRRKKHVISSRVRKLLSQSNSGFFTGNPQHSGWLFLEYEWNEFFPAAAVQTSNCSNPVSGCDCDNGCSCGKIGVSTEGKEGVGCAPPVAEGKGDSVWYDYYSAVTGVLSPPFSPSIFHLPQVLFTLIEALDIDSHSNSMLFPLERLILNNVDRGDYAWTHDMISIVNAYTTHVQWMKGNATGSHYEGELRDSSNCISGHDCKGSHNVHHTAGVLLAEDLTVLFEQLRQWNSHRRSTEKIDLQSDPPPSPSLVCFEKVFVGGSIELSVPFLSSAAIAKQFQEFLFRWYDINNGENRASCGDWIDCRCNEEGICANKVHDQDSDGSNVSDSDTFDGMEDYNDDHVDSPMDDVNEYDEYGGHESEEANTDHTDHTDSTNVSGQAAVENDASTRCAGPNQGLKITMLLRAKHRWIRNIPDILLLIEHMGIADKDWLYTHIQHFDASESSMVQQVDILSQTDIFISPHGAGLMNMIFMKPGSSVIEIMSSPWYELGYNPTALSLQLHYFVVPVTHVDQSNHCAFLKECLETTLLMHRRSLQCYGIRQCDVVVDIGGLEVVLWQASQSVRIDKRQLQLHQRRSKNRDEFYRKSYVTPLSDV